MPLNIATEAMIVQTGNMNQYTVQSIGSPRYHVDLRRGCEPAVVPARAKPYANTVDLADRRLCSRGYSSAPRRFRMEPTRPQSELPAAASGSPDSGGQSRAAAGAGPHAAAQ